MGRFGSFPVIVILFVVYFGLISLIILPFRIFSDPHRLKRKTKVDWQTRNSKADMDWMSKQG